MFHSTPTNNNSINTQLAQFTLNAMLSLFILIITYNWFFTPIHILAQNLFITQNTINTGLPNSDKIFMIAGPEFAMRSLGFFINLVFSLPIFYGFHLLRTLMKLYAHGKLFTQMHVKIIKYLAWTFIAYGILLFLYEPIISLVLTAFNPVGQKIISVGFGSDILFPICIGMIMLPIAHVMQEAYKIAQEQAYTV